MKVDYPQSEGEYWEPWQPQVGQRVRVRLRGECPYSVNTAFQQRGHEGCHSPCADGVVGTVASTQFAARGLDTAHHYQVALLVECRRDHEIPQGQKPCYADWGHYAAIELIPVDTEGHQDA